MPIRPSVLLLASFAVAACAGSDAGDTPDTGVAAAAAAATSAPPTAAPSDDDAMVALTNFRLTRERLDRFYAAENKLLEREAAMPSAERERVRDAVEKSLSEGTTLDAAARGLDAQPAIASAIREGGMTTREYLATSLALIQAGAGVMALEGQPSTKSDSIARAVGTHPDNFNFFRQHGVEIQRRQAEIEARREQLGG